MDAISTNSASPHQHVQLRPVTPLSACDPASSRERFYYPGLDGLRFVAFLGVFLFHALPAVAPALVEPTPRSTFARWISSVMFSGALGVDLFFVLSSFLITSLLTREMETCGALDVRAFWIRRILRIWPLYFSFLIVAAIVERVPWPPLLMYATFLGNWSPLFWETSPIIGPLWSVSVEEQFYFFWPLVLLAVPRRRLPWVCAAMLAASFGMRAISLALWDGDNHIWFNTFARLDPIAIGALLALRWSRREIRLSRAARAALVAGAVLGIVGGVAYWLHSIRDATPLTAAGMAFYLMIYFDVAVSCGAVIIATLASPRSPLSHPVLVYLGRISYGLYVFHVAGLRIVEPVWWPCRPVAALLLTILGASVSYRFLEQPFLRLKDRFTHVRSGPPVPPLSPMPITPSGVGSRSAGRELAVAELAAPGTPESTNGRLSG